MANRINPSYTNLIRELAITDFKLKYQGSVLGYLWSFAKPLMLFAVLYVVFTKVIKLGGSIPHYPLYLLLGIVLWTYFSDSTMTAMASIVDRKDIIRKVYFPRMVIVIASSLSALITLALNLLVIFVFMALGGIWVKLTLFPFVLLILELYLFSLGISLLLSSLYVKFRDFKHIWEVALQILFYITPIIYPLSFIPKRYIKFIALSPLAQIVQDGRRLLISDKTISSSSVLHWPWVLIPYLIPVLTLAIGYFYFRATAAKFAEEI